METNKIYQGSALKVLKTFPDKSINMVMTSPPYWALRDYGVDGQLGLESTFDEYITNLCNIFDEVKRVLRDDGSIWVNMGDTYSGGNGGSRWNTGKNPPISGGKERLIKLSKTNKPHKYNHTLQDKTLVMIPFRFAIEMVNRGWILRNDIIWWKRNCMPSSAKDRFTVDYEHVFFFTKNKKYHFEQQFSPMKRGTPGAERDYQRMMLGRKEFEGKRKGIKDKSLAQNSFIAGNPQGKNKRCIWLINPKAFKDAHFAVYPEKLCVTPIKAGSLEGGIVLDPFFGAGTTGLVALKLNRNFIGIELKKEYIDIANKRLKPWLEQERLK